MNFVIAAGGTGGHLFPGLAVGEVLVRRGHSVMLLISQKEIDSLATQGRTEFRIERLPGVGMPKLFSPAIVPFLFRFASGVKRCLALYRDFQPAAVLGMGGFTSTAPILAGRLRKAATFVHESNAIPGKANLLNARLARTVLLGFSECAPHFGRANCKVTGTPIRQTLIARLDKAAARTALGLDPQRATILVMGGSQGARGINQAVLGGLDRFSSRALQFVHLTGAEGEQATRDAYAKAGVPAFVAPFHHQMEQVYSCADLAIARSGAASITELSHFALPSILIPYPYAAEDHQTLNARIVEKAGAGILLPESSVEGSALTEILAQLLDDVPRLSEMSAAAARLAPSQAAERVADAMLDSR